MLNCLIFTILPLSRAWAIITHNQETSYYRVSSCALYLFLLLCCCAADEGNQSGSEKSSKSHDANVCP